MDCPNRETLPGSGREAHPFIIFEYLEPCRAAQINDTETDTEDRAEAEPCIIRFDNDNKRRVSERQRRSGDHKYAFGTSFYE